MAPLPWANAVQRDFLTSRLPKFSKAQDGKSLPIFWKKVYGDFFTIWPDKQAEAQSMTKGERKVASVATWSNEKWEAKRKTVFIYHLVLTFSHLMMLLLNRISTTGLITTHSINQTTVRRPRQSKSISNRQPLAYLPSSTYTPASITRRALSPCLTRSSGREKSAKMSVSV